MSQLGDIWVKIGADVSDFKKGLGGLGNIIGAAFAADTLIDFQKKIIAVQAEFQRYEAVLSNTLGSSQKAVLAMQRITELASKTPFQVNSLTDSFVRLANQGFVPTTKEMIKLGDLASSTGKDITQLAEAVIDAQVGEFERLKEFGIRAEKDGKKIIFSFKGISTEVDNTSKSIQEYLLSLGEVEGVSGSMEKISQTLGGKISNLDDNFTNLFKTIGDGERGALSALLDWANDFISDLNLVMKGVDGVRKEVRKIGIANVTDATITQMDELIEKYKAINKSVGGTKTDAEIIAQAYDAVIGGYAKALDSVGRSTQGEIFDKQPYTINQLKEIIAGTKEYKNNLLEAMKYQSMEAQKTTGLIEGVQKQIESLNEQREKAASISEITKIDMEIDRLEKKLSLIDAISERQRQAAENIKVPDVPELKMPELNIKVPELKLQLPKGLIESYQAAINNLQAQKTQAKDITLIAQLNEEIALLEKKLEMLNSIRISQGEDGENKFSLGTDKVSQDSESIIESLTGIIVETDLVAQAFDGLSTSIVSSMNTGSNALKAFVGTMISATGKYLSEVIKINAADKRKATGKIFNIAAQTAEGAGPFAAIVFPAILAGLMGLLSQAFRGGGGGVGGGGGRGFSGYNSKSSNLIGNQLNSSIDQALNVTGSMSVDGDKLMIYFKNRDTIKTRT